MKMKITKTSSDYNVEIYSIGEGKYMPLSEFAILKEGGTYEVDTEIINANPRRI